MTQNVPSDGHVTDTPGYRVYLVRRALGADPRHELPQRQFADMLNAKAKELGVDATYDSSSVTRIEKNERRLQLDDVKIIAAVDPLRRGRDWIAWGGGNGASIINPSTDRKLSQEEEERASAKAAQLRAKSTTSGRKRGRQGGR